MGHRKPENNLVFSRTIARMFETKVEFAQL